MLSGSGELRNELKTSGIRNRNKLVVNRSFQVPIFEANPVTGSAGELWYSAPDKALKFSYSYNTWSAGGALIITRTEHGGAGTQNAGIDLSGLSPAAIPGKTEEYSGSAWSEGGDMISGMSGSLEGAGIQNAAISMGGPAATNCTCTEVYNGTAWATETAMPTASYGQNMGASASDSAHTAGGSAAMSGTYDGTTWTNTTELSVPTTTYGAGGGDRDEHLVMSGYSGGTNYDTTWLWNGSAWVAKDDLTVGKRGAAGDCTAR